jgi:CheY-like chemotaxis protein
MRRLPLLHYSIAVLLLGLPSALRGQPVPTTRDAPAKSLEQIKAEGRQLIELRLSRLPEIAPRPITQILGFTRLADRLTFDSPLMHEKPGVFVIPLTGSKLRAMVAVSSGPQIGQNSFQFEYYDFDDPALVDRHLQVLAGPTLLQIARDVEYPDRTQTVALIENADGFILHVQVISTEDQGQQQAHPVDLHLSAPTLAQLRLEHPAEYEKYLRPAFADMGQEQVAFDVDGKIAWQVVAEGWKASPALAGEVETQVAKLNDDDFQSRNAADKAIRDLGGAAAVYLLAKNRSSLTNEQNQRIDAILQPYKSMPAAQVKALRGDANFLLDCLLSDDILLRSAALAHLHSWPPDAISFDVNQPAADRISAVNRWRAQLGPTTRND